MTTNTKEYQRAYYVAHREERKAYYREYNRKRKLERGGVTKARLFDLREDYKTPTKEEFQAIPQKELTYSQKYYAANKERIKAQQKEARERKKRIEKQRAYYEANKERIVAQQRAYYQRKAKEKRMSKTWYGRVALKFKSFFK